MEIKDYKVLLLSRYCGEFRPGTSKKFTDMKSSEDIAIDLRPMAEFTNEEITFYMVTNGYEIGFDGDTPVWLLDRDMGPKRLNESQDN